MENFHSYVDLLEDWGLGGLRAIEGSGLGAWGLDGPWGWDGDVCRHKRTDDFQIFRFLDF